MTEAHFEQSQFNPQPPSLNYQDLSLNWPRTIGLLVFHLLALLAPWFFSWSALGVAIALHWLCGSVGICLGYHRLLTHRSLQLPRWLEHVVVTIGALALQGGPLFWVANHRRHHAELHIAPAGRRWWEIDMTWWLILSLEQLGLAHHVNRPRLKATIAPP